MPNNKVPAAGQVISIQHTHPSFSWQNGFYVILGVDTAHEVLAVTMLYTESKFIPGKNTSKIYNFRIDRRSISNIGYKDNPAILETPLFYNL